MAFKDTINMFGQPIEQKVACKYGLMFPKYDETPSEDVVELQKPNKLPRVGEELDFYDDGKTSESRHYKGIVTHILEFEKGKTITNLFIDEWDLKEPDKLISRKSHNLIEVWEQNKKDCYWLFADTTDYFIGFACPEYDEYILWFARTKDGGWFSMDIQSNWQGGRLDVDGEITKRIQEEREKFRKWEETQEQTF